MIELDEKQNIKLFRNIFFTILAVSTNNFFKREPPNSTQYTYIVQSTQYTVHSTSRGFPLKKFVCAHS